MELKSESLLSLEPDVRIIPSVVHCTVLKQVVGRPGSAPSGIFPRPQQSSEGWPELEILAPKSGFPVYVMLPLDTVWLADRDGQKVSVVKREQALQVGLQMPEESWR